MVARIVEVLVSTEYIFSQDKGGLIYSDNGTRGYSFWKRYLEVFDSVKIIGRLSENICSGNHLVEGPGISIFPLPKYIGPWNFLMHLWELKKRVRIACTSKFAIILRAGTIGNLVWGTIRQMPRPYGVEVVGDPYDVFAPGVIKHPLRPFLRLWGTRQLRLQCANACAVGYVTAYTLQRRYPCPAFSIGVSDVDLEDAAIVCAPRKVCREARKFTLITVGSLSQLYKAPDVLIDALKTCVRQGLDLHLEFVGDGRYRPKLEAQVARLNLGKRVRFLGQLPAGDAVRARLDEADLFVLPSRTEGLPRALIEAMARGLPCIGSSVGGIPELLVSEDMVPPGDKAALAKKIYEVLINPIQMEQMAARNLERAKEYKEEILRPRRIAFYHAVRNKTEEWLMHG
jgi:glycosyltransferase involved in cell wall biosynthesis